MYHNLKICENSDCWEVMGSFPIHKCQFCWSLKFSTHKIKIWLVLADSTLYSQRDAMMSTLMNYKWVDHVFVRSNLWELGSNDCDSNGWYIHFIDVDDAPVVQAFINAKVSREWYYIWLE